jgi:hypothetical protein
LDDVEAAEAAYNALTEEEKGDVSSKHADKIRLLQGRLSGWF